MATLKAIDGNFGGDRLMTRYEFAAMLYRAIENGAALEEKIIKEFEPGIGPHPCRPHQR